jgi:hypothetical protein
LRYHICSGLVVYEQDTIMDEYHRQDEQRESHEDSDDSAPRATLALHKK